MVFGSRIYESEHVTMTLQNKYKIIVENYSKPEIKFRTFYPKESDQPSCNHNIFHMKNGICVAFQHAQGEQAHEANSRIIFFNARIFKQSNINL